MYLRTVAYKEGSAALANNSQCTFFCMFVDTIYAVKITLTEMSLEF